MVPKNGSGKVYVTIGSGQRHDVIQERPAKQLESNPSHELIQELCGEHPKLCALIGRQVGWFTGCFELVSLKNSIGSPRVWVCSSGIMFKYLTAMCCPL